MHFNFFADGSFATPNVDEQLAQAADADGLKLEDGEGLLDDELYLRPRIYKDNITRPVFYKNAVDLLADLQLTEGVRTFAIVSGSFVFGDVLKALVLDKGYRLKTLSIQTLSMSQENIDSLREIKDALGEDLQLMRIALSDYFYSHERHVREGRNTPALVPYLYRTLDDRDGRLDVAYASVHTKIVTFETTDGLKVVIDGSANLRSSSNIEQFRIECDAALHDWIEDYTDRIFETYTTMKRSVRGRKLWQTVAGQATDAAHVAD